MKVCLISPPTVTDFEDPDVAQSDAIRMIAEHAPVGILSLAAVLEGKGITPHIIDMNRLYYEYLKSDSFRDQEMSFSDFVIRSFASLSFDIFGFSTICSSYPLTLRIAEGINKTHPDATLILGGPQASVVDVDTLKAFPHIDLIVRGEAEETFPMTLDALSDAGKSFDAIPGITFRKGGEIVRNPNASVVLELDSLPMPAFHLYEEMKDCRYVPLELGRGCPFACTFCSTNDFFRRRFRLKSPDKVIDEMKRIKATYGISTFDLIHDMFTVDRKRVVAFCEAVLAAGEKFYWNCSARTDCIDEELIALMARAGCRGIFYGIETGSARLQQIVQKDLDLHEAMRMIECNDRHKITTAVSLITGFPDETMDDVADTVDFLMDSLRFDHAQPQLHLLAPLAETPIQSQHRDQLYFDDIFSDMSYQGWRQDPKDREMIQAHPTIFPNFYAVPTPHLDRQLVKELREFVLNSTQRFRWLILALHQNYESLVKVFTQFRAWYGQDAGRGPSDEVNADRYYSDHKFRDDFIEFVRTQYAADSSKLARAMSALLAYEASLSNVTDQLGSTQEQAPNGEHKSQTLLGLSSVPRLADGARLTELELNYKRIIKCLRKKGRIERVRPRPTTLILRPHSNKNVDIVQLSELSAGILHLCDGVRNVKEISTHLATSGEHVDDIAPEKVCIFGLEMLRQQGLIVITQPQSSEVSVAS